MILPTHRLIEAFKAADPRWEALMTPVDFEPGTVVAYPHRSPLYSYLIYDGLASLRYDSSQEGMAPEKAAKNNVSVALVGNNGMTGSMAMTSDLALPFSAVIETNAKAMQISTKRAREITETSPASRKIIDAYHRMVMLEQGFNFSAASRLDMRSRIASFLVQVSDLLPDTLIPLSQEKISLLMGWRRATVTVELGRMANEGIVSTERGRIDIVNEPKLIELGGPSLIDFKRNRMEYMMWLGSQTLEKMTELA